MFSFCMQDICVQCKLRRAHMVQGSMRAVSKLAQKLAASKRPVRFNGNTSAPLMRMRASAAAVVDDDSGSVTTAAAAAQATEPDDSGGTAAKRAARRSSTRMPTKRARPPSTQAHDSPDDQHAGPAAMPASKNASPQVRKAKRKRVVEARPMSPALHAKAARIQEVLQDLYPSMPCPLDSSSNFQLLIAVILSSQVRRDALMFTS